MGRRYDLLMGTLDEGMLVVNSKGTIVECNEWVARLFDCERRFLEGRSVLDLTCDSEAQSMMQTSLGRTFPWNEFAFPLPDDARLETVIVTTLGRADRRDSGEWMACVLRLCCVPVCSCGCGLCDCGAVVERACADAE